MDSTVEVYSSDDQGRVYKFVDLKISLAEVLLLWHDHIVIGNMHYFLLYVQHMIAEILVSFVPLLNLINMM